MRPGFFCALSASNAPNINSTQINGAGEEHEDGDRETEAHVAHAEVCRVVTDAGVDQQGGDPYKCGEEEGAQRRGKDEKRGLEDAEVADGSAKEAGTLVFVRRSVIVHGDVPCR